jgi:hypothetical protein
LLIAVEASNGGVLMETASIHLNFILGQQLQPLALVVAGDAHQ